MTGAPAPAAPLAGLVVLDLTRVLAGPYATQMLGDLGAEVWKVERPGHGDETRAWGPPFVGDQSAYFLSVNRNKRSAALDFGDSAHRAALLRAAAAADVVVENFLPGQLAPWGLDAASLRARRPELVVCSITGFGQDGARAALPGYDAVLQGFVGLMSVTGAEDGPPLKVGVALVDVLTGVHAASAILAALVGRFRGGAGAHLDVPLAEVGIASLVNQAQAALATGRPARRHGNAHPHIVPYQTFEAQDGLLVVAVGNDEQWERLCMALEAPEWREREAWRTNPGRVADRDRLVAAIAARVRARPRAAWLERLREAAVPAGAVRELDEVLGDPWLRERGFVDDSAPALLRLPWRIEGARPPIRYRPPKLGEHTADFVDRFHETS